MLRLPNPAPDSGGTGEGFGLGKPTNRPPEKKPDTTERKPVPGKPHLVEVDGKLQTNIPGNEAARMVRTNFIPQGQTSAALDIWTHVVNEKCGFSHLWARRAMLVPGQGYRVEGVEGIWNIKDSSVNLLRAEIRGGELCIDEIEQETPSRWYTGELPKSVGWYRTRTVGSVEEIPQLRWFDGKEFSAGVFYPKQKPFPFSAIRHLVERGQEEWQVTAPDWLVEEKLDDSIDAFRSAEPADMGWVNWGRDKRPDFLAGLAPTTKLEFIWKEPNTGRVWTKPVLAKLSDFDGSDSWANVVRFRIIR